MDLSIEGILFDMDGLMFDTERMSNEIWCAAGKRHGIPITPADVTLLRGCSRETGKQEFLKRFGADMPYDLLYAEKQAEMDAKLNRSVPVRPGLMILLEYLKQHGYRISVASSTRRSRVESNLALTNTGDYFHALVCGDDVKHCKPDPEVFLTAADALGIAPEHCMVLEDSYNGVRAAHAAGCYTVMIPDMDAPTPEMHALADEIAESLAAVPAILARIRQQGH